MPGMEGRLVDKRKYLAPSSRYLPDEPTRYYITLEVSEAVAKRLKKGEMLVLTRQVKEEAD